MGEEEACVRGEDMRARRGEGVQGRAQGRARACKGGVRRVFKLWDGAGAYIGKHPSGMCRPSSSRQAGKVPRCDGGERTNG